MKIKLLFGFISIFMLLNLYANASSNKRATSKKNDGTVLLPAQVDNKKIKMQTQNTANIPELKEFTEKYGKWTLMSDRATKTPSSAFGEPIQISGYSEITKDNAQEASGTFIKEFSYLLKVNPADLKYKQTNKVLNKWVSIYRQFYKNIEVLYSNVEIRMSSKAKVFAFGSDYYSNINVSTVPDIDYKKAANIAKSGLEYAKPTLIDTNSAKPKFWILPIAKGEEIDYRFVYEITVRTVKPRGNWIVYVDAHSGEILFRRNNILSYNTKVSVQGSVKPYYPTGNYIDVPFDDFYVNIGDTKYTSDSNGIINMDLSEKKNLKCTIEGKWAKVYKADWIKYDSVKTLSTQEIDTTINSGDNFVLNLQNNNSINFARNVYHYANVAHKWIRQVDTGLTMMDLQTQIILYYDKDYENVNAESLGDTIQFYALDSTVIRMAETPDVYYHEYGHSVTHKIFDSYGSQYKYGMLNLSCHEGIADLTASTMINDPQASRGFNSLDTNEIMRNLVNTVIYPDSISCESHYNGQILSGSFWDLRSYMAPDSVTRLFHFSRYLLPDDYDDGKAFAKWFLDVLTIDDNDDNLNNGTPHLVNINKCFNNHRIGSYLLIGSSFSHISLEDTKDTINPYNVNFDLTALSFAGYSIDSVFVHWTNDDFVTSYPIVAIRQQDGKFQASIPAQKNGTIVKYYMTAYDNLGQETITFSNGSKFDNLSKFFYPYEFTVGFSVFVTDNFETNKGWKIGVTDDKASTGKWSVAKPTLMDWRSYNYDSVWGSCDFYQPGANHTENGTKCLVTGAVFSSTYYLNSPNGKTTITSPVYNITNCTKPMLRFWYWMSNVADPYYYNDYFPRGSFYTEISNDSGSLWTRIYSSIFNTQNWFRVDLIIPDTFKVKNFRVRFVDDAPYAAKQTDRTTITKVLVDDMQLMSIDTGLVSVDISDTPELSFVCYPNPMENSCYITYNLPKPEKVSIKIYNLLGEEIITIADEYQNSGYKEYNWNGYTSYGTKINIGLYYIKFQTEKDLITNKLIVR